MLLKLIKGLAGIVIVLPLSVAATLTAYELVTALQPGDYSQFSKETWGLIIGFVFWVFLYFALPRPVRTYVLAHELTHALWGVLMGARVRGLKVSSKGGSVTLSKSNFLVMLAPYFFPFYTVCVIGLYLSLSVFFDMSVYEPFWLGLIGLSWGFHLTFTVTTLMEHQSDIYENGYIFSYLVIYFFNILGIALWIALIATPTLQDLVNKFGDNMALVGDWCFAVFQQWKPGVSE